MRALKVFILVAVLLTFFIGAALSSDQPQVALSFAIWKTPFVLSMFWWLLAATVIGLLLGLLIGAWINVKRRLANRKLRASLAEATTELEKLRTFASQQNSTPQQT